MTIRFEVGKSYGTLLHNTYEWHHQRRAAATDLCDANVDNSVEIVRRTDKTAWARHQDGEIKTCRLSVRDDVENIATWLTYDDMTTSVLAYFCNVMKNITPTKMGRRRPPIGAQTPDFSLVVEAIKTAYDVIISDVEDIRNSDAEDIISSDDEREKIGEKVECVFLTFMASIQNVPSRDLVEKILDALVTKYPDLDAHLVLQTALGFIQGPVSILSTSL